MVLKEKDTASRGAALCAGIGVGYFKNIQDIAALN